MITISGLRFRNLSIPSLMIPEGNITLIGPNGCGKSTLLKLIAGIHLPEQGSVLIDGISPRQAEIGWVNEFPDRNIIFSTVADEVASPLRFRHIQEKEIRSRTTGLLDYLGLTRIQDRPVQELSGGEKVIVAIAAAVIHRPEILVLDEYDSHLDAAITARINRLLAGFSIPHVIRCTQDLEAATRADMLIYLQGGRIHASGTPDSILPDLVGTPFYPLSWRCGYGTRL